MSEPPVLDAWAAARLDLASPLDRQRFDAVRLERLRATLEAARRTSPFYRRAAWPAGLPSSLADLARWPLTRPSSLVRGDPSFLAVSQGSVERMVTLDTSGTTGPAKRFAFAGEDRAATLAFFAAGMSVFTRAGDRVGIFFAGERPGGVGDGLAEAVRRIGAEPVFVPAASAEEAVAVLRAERPTVIAGAPVAMLAAGRVAASDGGAPVTARAVLASSEPTVAAVRWGLADAFGAEVHDHWGMTEIGWGGAVGCSSGAGLHLREADLVVEVVDPRTGWPKPDGHRGEIVVTTLTQTAMPLVRYATGDIGALMPEGAGRCRCGSCLRRLAPTVRRRAGGIVLPGCGRLTLDDLDDHLFAVPAVCDLRATIEPGMPPRLAVEVAVTDHRRDASTRAALTARSLEMPAIARATAAGRLAVDLGLAATTRLPVAGKRVLRVAG